MVYTNKQTYSILFEFVQNKATGKVGSHLFDNGGNCCRTCNSCLPIGNIIGSYKPKNFSPIIGHKIFKLFIISDWNQETIRKVSKVIKYRVNKVIIELIRFTTNLLQTVLNFSKWLLNYSNKSIYLIFYNYWRLFYF